MHNPILVVCVQVWAYKKKETLVLSICNKKMVSFMAA